MSFDRCIFALAGLMTAVIFLLEFNATVLIAVLIAVIVHEAGHITAVYVLGGKVNRLEPEFGGLRIDYTGLETELKNAAAALFGPAFGVIYGLLYNCFRANFASDTLLLSAKLSLLYSSFNLLPIIPLDGGRMFLCISELILPAGSEKMSRQVSLLFIIVCFLLGLILWIKGEGGALFSVSIWLLLM